MIIQFKYSIRREVSCVNRDYVKIFHPAFLYQGTDLTEDNGLLCHLG